MVPESGLGIHDGERGVRADEEQCSPVAVDKRNELGIEAGDHIARPLESELLAPRVMVE